jgi:hypothetical protein
MTGNNGASVISLDAVAKNSHRLPWPGARISLVDNILRYRARHASDP